MYPQLGFIQFVNKTACDLCGESEMTMSDVGKKMAGRSFWGCREMVNERVDQLFTWLVSNNNPLTWLSRLSSIILHAGGACSK
jgi:hypothetical protein